MHAVVLPDGRDPLVAQGLTWINPAPALVGIRLAHPALAHPALSNAHVSPSTIAASGKAPVSQRAETQLLGLRLLAFVSAQLQRAQSQLARASEDRHAGIHEARKSIRRVRATLALGAGAFGRQADALDDELARLARGLSRLRDAQALVEVLQRLAATAPAKVQAILPRAEQSARQRRDRLMREALQRDPELRARRRRLQAASARLQRLHWAAVDAAAVTRAMARSERRADKADRRVRHHPDDHAAWHVYRRRLRRLHQQDTLLSELQPSLRAPSARCLQHRAHALGVSQDDALLLSHCGRGSPFPPDQRKLLHAMAAERLLRARCG